MKSIFQRIQVLHLALLGGQVIFGGVVYFLAADIESNIEEDVFVLVVPLLLLSGMGAGLFLFKQKVAQAKTLEGFEAKMNGYFVAALLRMALLEGPVIFAFAAYLLTESIMFWGMGLGGVLLFLVLRPQAGQVAHELGLSLEERANL
ncbi:MAG: hypothetical protein ACFCUI_11040 [Bernardetiaceae bacterium]